MLLVVIGVIVARDQKGLTANAEDSSFACVVDRHLAANQHLTGDDSL
jgi:hypothetical protein